MVDRRELRTQFSMRALDMSEVFRGNYAGRVLGSPSNGYTIDMTAPEGPSTGGGKQAVQHIRLLPIGGVSANRPILNAGTITQMSLRAEVRTFEQQQQIFIARSKEVGLPFDKPSYDRLIDETRAFFSGQGFTVTTEAFTAAVLPASQSRTSSGGGAWKLIAICAILALGAFLVVFYLQK